MGTFSVPAVVVDSLVVEVVGVPDVGVVVTVLITVVFTTVGNC
jgi:hypothetical protein